MRKAMPSSPSSPYLNTTQAAQALGVSVSTVKRWVDEGVLPAHRTAGGHRKLLRAEVLALARQGEVPQGDWAALTGLPFKGPPADLGTAALELAKALLHGQGAEVRGIIGGLYAAGVSVEALADRVIAPALAVVGHDWENGKIDIWQEHRGTQLCAGALFELRKDLELRAEKNRPVAVGAAPAGDPYLLPTLLAQYVLLDAGWEAVNLGPNTPLGSLEQAVRQLRPRLLWLSVSYLEDEASFLHAYQALYRVAEGEGIAVAVGGRALAPALRSDMPYTTYGDRLEHLAAFARTLHPRPKRPKWGRPRRM